MNGSGLIGSTDVTDVELDRTTQVYKETHPKDGKQSVTATSGQWESVPPGKVSENRSMLEWKKELVHYLDTEDIL